MYTQTHTQCRNIRILLWCGVATISRLLNITGLFCKSPTKKTIFCKRDLAILEYFCGMGWLRLVGSLKLYVSFAKEPHKRDDILQRYSAKETCNSKEPTTRSHPIMGGFGLEFTHHGVAAISRLLKIIGLFCRISSLSWGSFAKETYSVTHYWNKSY